MKECVFMKKLFVLGVIALSFWSCAKSGDSNNPPAQQVVNSVDCVRYPQQCQGNVYNNNYGYQPYQYGYGNTYGTSGYNNGYPYSNSGGYFYNNGIYGAGSGPFHYMNNANYLCNCPTGTMPTYNVYGGLGCVNNGFVNGYVGAYAYWGWSTGPGNNQWTNIPQVSNHVGYSNQNCYNGVVQSCLTDQPNSCGNGYTCRASSAGSRMGLCVSNSAGGAGGSAGQIYR